MSLLNHDELKPAFDRVVEDLEKDISFQTGVISVYTNLLKNLKSEARVGGFGGKGYDKSHTFYCDEREPLAGGNEAPAPLEYFVAGLNLSLQNTCIFWAVKENVNIKSFRIQSYAHFSRLGIFDGGDPAINKIVCEVSIESDTDAKDVQKVIQTAAKHSVAYQTLDKCVSIEQHIAINGKRIQ